MQAVYHYISKKNGTLATQKQKWKFYISRVTLSPPFHLVCICDSHDYHKSVSIGPQVESETIEITGEKL